MRSFKSFLVIVSAALFTLSSCSGGKKLSTVEGFSYEDGILSFNEVSGATSYEYVFTHKGEELYRDTLDMTSIDVESLGLEGNIELTVIAKNAKASSEPAKYSFTVMSTFTEVIFEAENYLYNFGTGKSNSNFRNNPLASNGAYVGGLDDAGHGIYINYLSPFAGTFTFESYYCYDRTSAIQKAHHDVWVNGAYQTKFDYTEVTGWGGATFNPSKATTSITLVEGWNTISIMKNGNSSDNWGDFAELDYLKLIGNNEKYNIDSLDKYGERPAYFRLEAEMGSPRRKGASGLYECKNPCIVEDAINKYSNGFIMGNVESKYDGVEWHFDSPVAAKYKIQISYASGVFDGSKKARPSFIVTQKEVGLQKNIDFMDNNPIQMDELPYTGWNKPVVAEQSVELELQEGDNFIYCLLLDGSGFFQIDYCDLTFVEEI